MTATLPKFRADLTASRQTTAEGSVVVIKDAARDRFFRLPEEGHFIATQLDGQTPLDVVRRRAEEAFHAIITSEELQSFIRMLSGAGLLDTGKQPDARRHARRIQGTPLYLRIRLFDPDLLFNRMIGRIGFFFTPWFLAFSALVIVAGICVASLNWEEAVQTLPRVFQLSAIPIILPVVFLVIATHEFAHGLTCKRFGGQVHEIGFFLVYLQPALYCNVSDAWLFPEKSKRLWVGFAGPYFELFIWGLATILWRLTDVESWINYLSFIVMMTSGLKTLINFNPLIKLDGYYLLSDWLEIPNLRKKGFACFGGLFKKALGGSAEILQQLTRREKRICIGYGLVAGVGSICLLGYAVSKFGASLLQQRQPLALAMSAWLLGVSFNRRFKRMFHKSKNTASDPDDFESMDASDEPAVKPATAPAKSIAEQTEPAKPKKASTSWSRLLGSPKRLRLLAATALAGVAVAGLLWLRPELRIKGPFDVLPIHNADVRAGVEGIIDEICVEEGQTVQQGDLIARLDDRDLRAELLKTDAAIKETQARLKLLVAGPRAEAIERGRIVLTKDEEAIKFAMSRLERDRQMFDMKLLSKQELEDSEANLALRQGESAEAKSKLDELLAGNRPEEIEAMNAALTRLETEQHYLENQLNFMRVLSPASGVVATPARQLMELKRQLVKKGDLIAKVFDLKTITAEMVISERDIADIRVGQPVVLKARAYPEMTFHGTVKAIATAAQSASSSSSSAIAQLQGGGSTVISRSAVAPKTVTITTEIDNSSLLLKPEMTGQAKISCGKRRLLDVFMRRVARTVKVEFWSWW